MGFLSMNSPLKAMILPRKSPLFSHCNSGIQENSIRELTISKKRLCNIPLIFFNQHRVPLKIKGKS